jgi:hypothetical protein
MRFNEVQGGGIFGLEDELPAGVGEGKEEHIRGAVGAQVIEDDVDAFKGGGDPALDLLQERDDVGSRAPLGRPGEDRAGVWLESAEDLAGAATTIVDLLSARSAGRALTVMRA